MFAPANSLSRIAFYTLAGVSEARLGGEEIRGKWSDYPVEVGRDKPSKLAEDFANWPDSPEAILTFTRRYGPLELHRFEGTQFSFSLSQWRNCQSRFRETWEAFSRTRPQQLDATALQTVQGEQLCHRKTGLEYKTANLWRLLLMNLAAIPTERLRKCARPDCPHAYFVPHHLKQSYCSDVCARWGQRQWKLKWWAERGREWREGRKEKARRAKAKRNRDADRRSKRRPKQSRKET